MPCKVGVLKIFWVSTMSDLGSAKVGMFIASTKGIKETTTKHDFHYMLFQDPLIKFTKLDLLNVVDGQLTSSALHPIRWLEHQWKFVANGW